jgi:bifunctional non-homologous end joining protein LigD
MSGLAFRAPMLATLVDEPVDGEEWIFERKFDGVRLIAVRDGDTAAVWSRNGIDRSGGFPELVEVLLAQSCDRFVADGEVVAFDGSNTSFERLQHRSGLNDPDAARATGIAVHYYLFDLLHLGDDDLEDEPLRHRKTLLRDALHFDDPLRFSAHRNACGTEYHEQACSKGWEGVIAKRADSRYVHNRSRDWLKLKCVGRQELVIGGFTDPRGSRVGLGALLVGYHDDGDFVYAGRIGTGFDDETLHELRATLDSRERVTSPFDRGDPDDDDGVHWVTPDLVCAVGFTEWTRAGRLRHPRFLGLRRDKDAADVVREQPTTTP